MKKGSMRQTITMVLGFLTMLVSALYVFFWNYSIYTAYTGKAVYGLLRVIGIRHVVIGSLMAHAFQIALVVLTVLGVKYFFDACRSAEYQRLISGGYAFLGGVSFIYLIGLYISTFVFSRDYFQKKANSSYYMMIAFILLIIYALYKCLLAKEKAHSIMNILLIAGMVLAFLAGGILRQDAHYDIVGNNAYWAGKAVAAAMGLGQAMPFIFLTYFELFYLPDRIKHPEKYEGYIVNDVKGDEGEESQDEVAEEMEQVKGVVGGEKTMDEVNTSPKEPEEEDELEDISDVIEGKFKL